jgi:hypothetical protein
VRLNQLHDGFSLAQVNAAVEKCTTRKLARGSQSGALSQAEGKNLLSDCGTAMKLEFHHVLTCITVWRAHDDSHALINDLISVMDMPIDKSMGFQWKGMTFQWLKKILQDPFTAFSGNTDNGNATLARCSGNCRYSVIHTYFCLRFVY